MTVESTDTSASVLWEALLCPVPVPSPDAWDTAAPGPVITPGPAAASPAPAPDTADGASPGIPEELPVPDEALSLLVILIVYTRSLPF